MLSKQIYYAENKVSFQATVLPQDTAMLQTFINNLSPVSIRSRFGRSIKPEYLLETFTGLKTNLFLVTQNTIPIALCDYSDLQIDDSGLAYSEIARIVRDDYQNQGYGTLIHHFFVQQLRALGANYMLSQIDMENTKSLALARKNNFKLHYDYQNTLVEARFFLQ